jgi:PAS domain S-box-containing protein
MEADVARRPAADDGPPGGDRSAAPPPRGVEPAAFLANAAVVLAEARGYRAALSAVARLAVPGLADWCTLHVRDTDGSIRQLAATHVDAAGVHALREAEREAPVDPAGASIVARILRTGSAELLGGSASDADAPVSGPASSAVRTRSLLAVPLVFRETTRHGRAHGAEGHAADAVLTWGVGAGRRRYDASDLPLAEQVARIASAALRNALRLDAAEQHHAEAEAARQQVTAALETMTDGLFTIDRRGRVTYLNPAAARLWRQPREAVLGRPLWEIFPDAVGTSLFSESQRAMERGISVEYESFYAPLGAWLNVRVFPAAEGLSVHLREITERRRADEERERLLADAQAARQVAESANQAKADFLASMSHELRTPLNAILGYVSLLADGITGPINPAQSQQLARVAASARHLLALIEEILSFARVESGSQEVRAEATDLDALAREAARLIEPAIETQGLRFLVETTGERLVAWTDARMVRQILLNLLANAARFTPPGGEVALRVRATATEAWLEVRDTGIGIAPEHHERIFDPFWQVAQGKNRRVGGTGLGLTVSRRLARLLGGDVTVESAPGAGSTFVVRLPVEAPAPPADDGAPS